MNNAYDESGFVVATHPLQEAQHDGVTVIGRAANNAPERIEFGGGYYSIPEHSSDGQAIAIYHVDKGAVGEVAFDMFYDFVAAMHTQVSESDEAVARDKLNTVYRERVGCSVAFARAALELGWKAGLGLDAKGQQVLYVDTPNGQVSWHIWDTENDLIVGLPQYDGEWDGEFRGRDATWCIWQCSGGE